MIELDKLNIHKIDDFPEQIVIGDKLPNNTNYLRCYKGFDLIHKRKCIIRLINIRIWIETTSLSLEDLIEDLNIWNSLKHSKIAKIYEVYEHGDILWVIHEGSDTDLCNEIVQKIKSGFIFNELFASSIIKQLCSVLSFCHQNNIYFFNIKPHGIVFCDDDQMCLNKTSPNVKLCDFSSAVFIEEQKSNNSLKIKVDKIPPHFLPPESLIHNEISTKSDVWNCGVILYIMLTGSFPISGSDSKIRDMVISNSFQPNGKQWSFASQEARDLILKMLKSSPTERISIEAIRDHKFIRNVRKSVGADDVVYKGNVVPLSRIKDNCVKLPFETRAYEIINSHKKNDHFLSFKDAASKIIKFRNGECSSNEIFDWELTYEFCSLMDDHPNLSKVLPKSKESKSLITGTRLFLEEFKSSSTDQTIQESSNILNKLLTKINEITEINGNKIELSIFLRQVWLKSLFQLHDHVALLIGCANIQNYLTPNLERIFFFNNSFEKWQIFSEKPSNNISLNRINVIKHKSLGITLRSSPKIFPIVISIEKGGLIASNDQMNIGDEIYSINGQLISPPDGITDLSLAARMVVDQTIDLLNKSLNNDHIYIMSCNNYLKREKSIKRTLLRFVKNYNFDIKTNDMIPEQWIKYPQIKSVYKLEKVLDDNWILISNINNEDERFFVPFSSTQLDFNAKSPLFNNCLFPTNPKTLTNSESCCSYKLKTITKNFEIVEQINKTPYRTILLCSYASNKCKLIKKQLISKFSNKYSTPLVNTDCPKTEIEAAIKAFDENNYIFHTPHKFKQFKHETNPMDILEMKEHQKFSFYLTIKEVLSNYSNGYISVIDTKMECLANYMNPNVLPLVIFIDIEDSNEFSIQEKAINQQIKSDFSLFINLILSHDEQTDHLLVKIDQLFDTSCNSSSFVPKSWICQN